MTTSLDRLARIADWTTVILGPLAFLLSMLQVFTPSFLGPATTTQKDMSMHVVLWLLFSVISWLFCFFAQFRAYLRVARRGLGRYLFGLVCSVTGTGVFLAWGLLSLLFILPLIPHRAAEQTSASAATSMSESPPPELQETTPEGVTGHLPSTGDPTTDECDCPETPVHPPARDAEADDVREPSEFSFQAILFGTFAGVLLSLLLVAGFVWRLPRFENVAADSAV